VKKQRYTPIAAVVAMHLKEDEEPQIENVVEEDVSVKPNVSRNGALPLR